jgi:U32 family peptidase
VTNYDEKTQFVTVEERNFFEPGDEIEIIGPKIKPFRQKLDIIYNDDMEKIERANVPLMNVKFKVNKDVVPYSIVRKRSK